MLIYGIFIWVTACDTCVPQLIIADANLELFVASIVVQGRLRMGHPNCRLRSTVKLTFAPTPGQDMAQLGIQVAPGGSMDAFGALYTPSWTRLGLTANAGDVRILLKVRDVSVWADLWSVMWCVPWIHGSVNMPCPCISCSITDNQHVAQQERHSPTSTTLFKTPQDAVNWRPGQDIFVATSIWRDEISNQNEARTIQQVEQGGRVLVLSAPLQHAHYGYVPGHVFGSVCAVFCM